MCTLSPQAPGPDQPLNLDVLDTVQWEDNAVTLPAGCVKLRYGPRGDQNPRIPVTLAKSLVKELVEEARELEGMEKDVSGWLTKGDVWCIYWETFLVAFISVDRVPCKGF